MHENKRKLTVSGMSDVFTVCEKKNLSSDGFKMFMCINMYSLYNI